MDNYLVLDLSHHACVLNSCISHMLTDPRIPGLYLKNVPSRNPIINFNNKYFVKGSDKPVNVLTVNEAIYDENWNLVLPSTMSRDKDKFLSTTPEINPNLFYIIHDFVQSYFEYICPYSKSRFYENKLKLYFKEEYKHAVDEGVLSYLLDSITLTLANFAKGETWREYDVKFQGGDLLITKGEDFRITDWMNRHYESKSK